MAVKIKAWRGLYRERSNQRGIGPCAVVHQPRHLLMHGAQHLTLARNRRTLLDLHEGDIRCAHRGVRYRSMNAPQRRTFWACPMGRILDAIDVQLLAFVIPTLLALWGVTSRKPASSAPRP
jgi:hypothetical protein